jgi:hypothetical protein
MTNVSTSAQDTPAAPATRRPFVAPAVEELGQLQALTQLQGLSF